MVHVSVGKSPVIKFCTDYLTAKEGTGIKMYRQEKKEYEAERRIWERKSKKEKDAEPEPVPLVQARRYTLGDATSQAVGQRLERNPLGLVMIRDELKAFFGSFGKYKNGGLSETDLQYWIEIFNGISLLVDRIGREDEYVPFPAVSIIGGIQTGILAQTLKERSDFLTSGFGARFLMVMPVKEPVCWNLRIEPDMGITAGWNSLIETILSERETAIVDGEVEPLYFGIEKAGQRTIETFQNRHARNGVFEQGAVEAALNKAGMLAARIALVLHIAELAENGISFSEKPAISEKTIENACRLVDWYLAETFRIYEHVLEGNPVDGELTAGERLVMKLVLKLQKPETAADMYNRHGETQRGKFLKEGIESPADLEVVLNGLVAQGRLTRNLRKGDGRDGREIYEFFVVQHSDGAKPSKNVGKIRGYSTSTMSDTEKNDFSEALSADEDVDEKPFGYYTDGF